MALSGEDRMEILQLLSEGKISVEEAGRILSTEKGDFKASEESNHIKISETDMDESQSVPGDSLVKKANNSSVKPSWLHIQVSDLTSGKDKVTVNIPLSLVRAGLNIGSRYSPEIKGIEWDDMSAILTQEKGILVDVQDEEDNEHVQIFVD